MRLKEFVEPASEFQLNEEDMSKIEQQVKSGSWVEFTDMEKMAQWVKSVVSGDVQ